MLGADLDTIALLLAVPDDLVFLVADRFHVHLSIARLPGLSPGIVVGGNGLVRRGCSGAVEVGIAGVGKAARMITLGYVHLADTPLWAVLDPEEQ
jgi:hypothetical protein